MSGAAHMRSQALRLHAQGLSKREIGARLGVSVFTVSALVRRALTFPERACRLCGERFVPTNGRQRYCRPEHRVLHALLDELQCPSCGATFTPRPVRQPERSDPERAPETLHAPRRPRPFRSTVAAWTEYVEVLERDAARLRAELEARAA
jgi:hypothetical protein